MGSTGRGEQEWFLDFWEWEQEWLNLFPNFKIRGTGMIYALPIECDPGIPGNGREREEDEELV